MVLATGRRSVVFADRDEIRKETVLLIDVAFEIG